MKCSITRCDRDAVVSVTFDTGGTQRYCWRHAYDRDQCLRWPDRAVAHVLRHQ